MRKCDSKERLANAKVVKMVNTVVLETTAKA